jgi:hypothetical protein
MGLSRSDRTARNEIVNRAALETHHAIAVLDELDLAV